MKARVKRTGQIVNVFTSFDNSTGTPRICYEVLEDPGIQYLPEELDFYITFDHLEEVVSDIQAANIEYWEKLKHQYAGMAMQGMLASSPGSNMSDDDIAYFAVKFATALVEKLKEGKV